jgi:hypothetical protein
LKSFQIGYVTLSNTLKINQKPIVWQVPGHLEDRRKSGKYRVQNSEAYLPSG